MSALREGTREGETAQDISVRFMGMSGSSQKCRIQGEVVSAGLWQVYRLRRSIQKGQHSYKEMPEMCQVIRGRPAGGGSGEKAQRREPKEMNRKELARVMAARRGKTIQEAGKWESAMLDAMADALRKGEEVRLIGFGVLRAVDVPAREGRDPRTHAAIQIKAHKKIKFTPSHLIL